MNKILIIFKENEEESETNEAVESMACSLALEAINLAMQSMSLSGDVVKSEETSEDETSTDSMRVKVVELSCEIILNSLLSVIKYLFVLL